MTNPISSTIEYFRSARAELEKVTWPSRQETLRYSLLVIGVSIVMAAFFAAIDLGLAQTTDYLLSRRPTTNVANPAAQPVVPDLSPSVEAVDANGNPVPLKVTPLNENGDAQGGIKITP